MGTNVAERRLTLLAAKQRPSAIRGRNSIRRPTSLLDSKKKDSTRDKQITQAMRTLKYIDVFAAVIAAVFWDNRLQ